MVVFVCIIVGDIVMLCVNVSIYDEIVVLKYVIEFNNVFVSMVVNACDSVSMNDNVGDEDNNC